MPIETIINMGTFQNNNMNNNFANNNINYNPQQEIYNYAINNNNYQNHNPNVNNNQPNSFAFNNIPMNDLGINKSSSNVNLGVDRNFNYPQNNFYNKNPNNNPDDFYVNNPQKDNIQNPIVNSNNQNQNEFKVSIFNLKYRKGF